jgi:hypothetical protein
VTPVADFVAGLARVCRDYRTLITLTLGAAVLLLAVWAVLRFRRSPAKSTLLARYAALATMVWTSEGLFHVTVDRMHAPRPVALFAFAVFELGALAAAMFAEEQRATTGLPGAAGRYVFVIAVASGSVSALGEDTTVGGWFRLVLPPLFVGLWWILLNAPRPSDSDEMRAERARRRQEQEATWVYTPRTVAVKLGLMKPGRSTTTDAQREHQIGRMVVAADRIAAGGRGVGRARRKLRKLARTSTPEMIAAVAVRVRQAVDAEALMVPASASQSASESDVGAEVAEILADRQADSEPPEDPTQEPPAEPTDGRQDPASGTAKNTVTRTARKPATEPASDAAKKVVHWAAKMPDATNAELAAKAKVSTRTVERYRPARETASEPVNGSHPQFANQ